MKTLDRYIASTFLKNFLMGAMGLTSLYVFQALLGQLIDHEFPAPQLVFHQLLMMPQIFVQMTPPAILIATVLTLSGFNRSQELVACYSIGVGLSRVVLVILTLVFLVSCTTLILQDRILPPLFKKRTTYYWREMKKRTDFFLDIKQNKIWYRSKNLIYNLRTFDQATQAIKGLAIYTFNSDFDLIQTVEAETARYSPEGWVLEAGTVTVFSPEEQFPLNQRFKTKKVHIPETPKDFQEIEKEVDGLRFKELYRYIGKTQDAGADTKSYWVKFHSRISMSFIPLVMAILGVPFSVRNRREGGVAKDLGFCLGMTFFYWLFYSIGLSMGTNGTLHPILAAWGPTLLFTVVAGALISRLGK